MLKGLACSTTFTWIGNSRNYYLRKRSGSCKNKEQRKWRKKEKAEKEVVEETRTQEVEAARKAAEEKALEDANEDTESNKTGDVSLENIGGDVVDEDTKTNTTTSEEGVGTVDLIGDPTVDSKESDLPAEKPSLNKSDKSNDVDLPDAETNEETKTDNEQVQTTVPPMHLWMMEKETWMEASTMMTSAKQWPRN